MVGIIVTGHGRFADGITSCIEVIAGKQENYVAVNFEHEVDQLTNDLKNAIESLKDCEGILVFCDLAGGSPFKTIALLSQEYENLEIIAGTNMPMIAEIAMARSFGSDLKSLVNMAVRTGKEQVIHFHVEALKVQEENEDFSDGI